MNRRELLVRGLRNDRGGEDETVQNLGRLIRSLWRLMSGWFLQVVLIISGIVGPVDWLIRQPQSPIPILVRETFLCTTNQLSNESS